MKRNLITTFVWIVGLVTTLAAPVSEQAAKRAAMDFLRQQGVATTRGEAIALTRAVTEVADGEDAGIFVFNSPSGYVVMSADDDLPAVLAYGRGIPYDSQTAPPALQALLEAYHVGIATKAFTRADVPTHSDVAPLVKAKWNQRAPYNNLCPEGSPTGCVATAMAQVMHYHQWPASYDWSKMKTSYSDTDTGAAADAVAKLMADCGEKVFMKYGKESSSAKSHLVSEALRYDFGYAETTEFVPRYVYTARSWDALIYSEVAAKRPVLYSGNSVSSGRGEVGHEFVIDGYEVKGGAGYYHVNWGWGGSSDDYFLLSALNPTYQYTGGNAGSSGYSYIQYAVIGIQPAAEPLEKTTRFSVERVSIKDDTGSYTRTSTSVDFPALTVSFSFFNTAYPEEAREYDYAIALYQDRKLVKILEQAPLKDAVNYVYKTDALAFNKGISMGRPVAFGSGLSDGKYQIRILSRESGKTAWTWGQKAFAAYVEVNISGTTMTTTTQGNVSARGPFNFDIHSVTVSEEPRVGKPMAITINLTDKNESANAPVFVWGNASIEAGVDSYQLLAGGGTNLDPGATGEVTLEYTPQRSGTFNFVVSGSSENCDTQLYTFSVEVAEMSMADVEISIDKVMVDGAGEPNGRVRKVAGQRLSGKVSLTNNGTETYNDALRILLYNNTEAKGTYHSVNSQTVNVKLAVGQSMDIAFQFNDLNVDEYYGIIVYALERGENKKLNGLNSDTIFNITGGSGIAPVELDEEDADVYNLNGVRVGKASELKTLPKGIYIIHGQKRVVK